MSDLLLVATGVAVADMILYIYLHMFADLALRFWPDAAATRRLVRVVQILWLLAGPGLVVVAVHSWGALLDGDAFRGLVFAAALLGLWRWWKDRNWPDDDNPWKRLLRRAAARVAAVGNRLVVVPS
jgi:hypothetical protein